MRNVPENELFSAYLDGELTADEQVQVEQLLATSADARLLLDELRTLSTTLQALPQYKLGEDLSEKVLRAAERRMLTEEPAPNVAAAPRDARPVSPSRPLWRRFVTPRAAIWSGLAVGVAVMLTVFAPEGIQPGDDGGIVRAPVLAPEPIPPAEIRPAEEVAVEERLHERDVIEKGRLARGSADKYDGELAQTAAPDTSTPEGTTVPTVRGKAGAAGRGFKTGPPAELVDGIAAKKPAARKTKAGELMPQKPTAEAVANNRPASAATAPQGATPGGGGGGGAVQIGKRGPVDSPNAMSHAQTAGKQYQPADDATSIGDRRGGYENGAEQTIGGGTQAAPAVTLAQPVAGVLLVQCDVSAEAVRSGSFNKVLASNGIALQADDTETRTAVSGRGPKLAQKQQTADADFGAALVSGGLAIEAVEVVYVEATAAQIEGTLRWLAAETTQFPSVLVEPAPGETSQRGLRRFNRRAGQVRQDLGGKASQTYSVEAAEAPGLSVDRADHPDGPTQTGRARRFELPDGELQRQLKSRGAFAYRHSGTAAPSQARPKAEAAAPAAPQFTPADAAPTPAEKPPQVAQNAVDEPLEPQAESLAATQPPRSEAPERALAEVEREVQQPPPTLGDGQAPAQPPPRPQPTYRALFVLRMIPAQTGAGINAAASIMEEAGAADAARMAIDEASAAEPPAAAEAPAAAASPAADVGK